MSELIQMSKVLAEHLVGFHRQVGGAGLVWWSDRPTRDAKDKPLCRDYAANHLYLSFNTHHLVERVLRREWYCEECNTRQTHCLDTHSGIGGSFAVYYCERCGKNDGRSDFEGGTEDGADSLALAVFRAAWKLWERQPEARARHVGPPGESS